MGVTLESLIADAWLIYDQEFRTSDSLVVRPSMPILYFGDSEAYSRSAIRILTVGLNPSREEFPIFGPTGFIVFRKPGNSTPAPCRRAVTHNTRLRLMLIFERTLICCGSALGNPCYTG